ncbi:MAG TPA: tetratricopeptide repeat protein, partial [Myxococcaceae bacterium]|nr:tetratricopeptide repeat protein [Myxococcaceae bacterium]
PWWASLLLPAAIVAAVALAMGHAVGHPFLRANDELETVVENPVVQGPLLQAFGAAFRTISVGAWAPLHLISHSLDRAVFGEWAGGSVLVNLLLHVLNALLVAGLVERLGAPRLAVWVAAMVFAIHPVQVESVVSITQRKTVLSTFFLLGAMHAWISYATAPRERSRQPYALALLSGVAALLTKPVAVILPLTVALLDIPLRRARASWQWIVEKLPFGAAAVAVVVITVLSKTEITSATAVTGQTRVRGFAGLDWYGGGPLQTFLTELTVVPRYFGLILWPRDLSIIYTPPVRTGVDLTVFASSLLLIGISAVAILLARRQPRITCWIGLFFVGLLPVSQIIPQTTLMNDRYLYVPLVGGAPLVGEMLALGAARLPRIGRRVLVAGGVALGLLLVVISRERVSLWASDLALWSDAARKAPEARLAWYNLGHFREETGDPGGATDAFVRASELDPADPFSASHASALLMRRGEFGRALPLAERAARLIPSEFDTQYNVGFLRFVLGDVVDARAAFEHAVELQPRKCEAWTLLAHALALTDQPARASVIYERIRQTPCDGADVGLYRAFVAGELRDESTSVRELQASFGSIHQEQLGDFLKEPTLIPLLTRESFALRVQHHLASVHLRP